MSAFVCGLDLTPVEKRSLRYWRRQCLLTGPAPLPIDGHAYRARRQNRRTK